MVSGAGSSFTRVAGFASAFRLSCAPVVVSGRRLPNDRLWGCDPGTLASDVLWGLELCRSVSEQAACQTTTAPPLAYSERCLLEPYKIGQIDLNIASELEFFARF
jgi:hypothetical protein